MDDYESMLAEYGFAFDEDSFNTSDAYDYHEDILTKTLCQTVQVPNTAMAVVMSLIVIIGLFGNGVVFFVIIVLKEYEKSVAHWYVLQLAIADTLFLLMLPFTAYSDAIGQWTLPDGLCKAKEGILFVNFYASIAFLTIMSFDRYLAVTRLTGAGWAQEVRTMPFAIVISIVTWCACIALATPLYTFSNVDRCRQCVYEFPASKQEKCERAGVNKTFCDDYLENEVDISYSGFTGLDGELFSFKDVDLNELNKLGEDLFETEPEQMCKYGNSLAWLSIATIVISRTGVVLEFTPSTMVDEPFQSFKTWLFLNFFVAFVMPLIAICICYGLILKTMMNTGTMIQNSNQRRYRRRVTIMVLALVSLFIVTWLPWYAVKLARLRGFAMSHSGCTKLLQFTFVLAYLNSALNPYFYSFMGSHFYRRFAKARSTAAQRSRLLSAISRMSAHGDSCTSHSDKHSHHSKRKGSKRNHPLHSHDSDGVSTHQTEKTTL